VFNRVAAAFEQSASLADAHADRHDTAGRCDVAAKERLTAERARQAAERARQVAAARMP
jgi:hypothetical protein